MSITTLLLDADGVVQRNPTFGSRIETLFGDRATLAELFAVEHRTVTGEGDLMADIDAFLDERGIDATAAEVMSVWVGTRPIDGVLELVGRVRAAGVAVYLATNQNPVRGQYMIDNLGYEDHFDGQFHSFQLGLAKPDPQFFREIVDRLRIEPVQTLFLDDLPDNVEGARAAGLVAEHVDRDSGAAGVEAILIRHGLLD